MIDKLEQRETLREYQMRELVLCRGECLMQTGKSSEAIVHLSNLQQRLELQRETDDHLMARVYDRLGTAHFLLANLMDAHAHYLRAFQLTQRFNAVDLVSARISYNLGMTCRHLNRYTEAISYLTRAESFFKKNSDMQRLAQTYVELGITFRVDKNFELADHYLQESLSIYRALNIVSMATHVRRTHASVVLAETDPLQAIAELKDCASEFENAGTGSGAYRHMRILHKHCLMHSRCLKRKVICKRRWCNFQKTKQPVTIGSLMCIRYLHCICWKLGIFQSAWNMRISQRDCLRAWVITAMRLTH